MLVSQECLVPPGPRACLARPATQVGEGSLGRMLDAGDQPLSLCLLLQGAPGCPERKETRASRAWMASKA